MCLQRVVPRGPRKAPHDAQATHVHMPDFYPKIVGLDVSSIRRESCLCAWVCSGGEGLSSFWWLQGRHLKEKEHLRGPGFPVQQPSAPYPVVSHYQFEQGTDGLQEDPLEQPQQQPQQQAPELSAEGLAEDPLEGAQRPTQASQQDGEDIKEDPLESETFPTPPVPLIAGNDLKEDPLEPEAPQVPPGLGTGEGDMKEDPLESEGPDDQEGQVEHGAEGRLDEANQFKDLEEVEGPQGVGGAITTEDLAKSRLPIAAVEKVVSKS